PPRSRWVAGFLGVFLGWIGIHRFYLGYTRIGVIQVVLTMLSGGAAGLWGITEGILILAGLWGEDAYRRPLVSRRPNPPVMLDSRWLERLLVAIFVAVALSAGVAMIADLGMPGVQNRAEAFLAAFAVVLTFVIAMTAAATLSSLLALRIHSMPAPPLLGRLVVFGTGLLALLAAAAFCREMFPPVGALPSTQAWWQALRQFDGLLEAVVGGLAVAMLLVNWARLLQRGTEGRVELGSAVWAGIVAGVASLFWNERYYAIAGGISATSSLTLQSAAFFRLRSRWRENDGRPGAPSGSAQRQATPPAPSYEERGRGADVEGQADGPHSGPYAATAHMAGGTPAPYAAHRSSSERACTDRARRVWQSIFGAILAVPAVAILASALDVADDVVPFCIALGAAIAASIPWLTCVIHRRRNGRRVESSAKAWPGSAPEAASPNARAGRPQVHEAQPDGFILRPPAASAGAELPRRSNAARVFWGMVATALLCGAIVCFIALATVRMGQEEGAGALAGGLAMLAAEVFPLSKVTRRRRSGVYREWLRPFFIAICLAAAVIGATVLGGMRLHDEEALVAIGFLVFGVVFALFFTVVRGPGAGLVRPTAEQAAQRPDRSRFLRPGAGAVVAFMIALLVVVVLGDRMGVRSLPFGYARYEIGESRSVLATRDEAREACAKSVVAYLRKHDLVNWTPDRPFTLVVSSRTVTDQTDRNQWDSALLGALRAAYPHADPHDVQVVWERRKTAAGAHWTGEGVADGEVVIDLDEERSPTRSRTTIHARVLAKAKGSLYAITLSAWYKDAPQPMTREGTRTRKPAPAAGTLEASE
ncbi:MAG: NINE protein, partial [Phycisphaerae bacterium]